MALFRIDLDAPDLDQARSLEGALTELMEPAPSAVSAFEQGSGYRVSAYWSDPPPVGAVQSLLERSIGGDRASIACRTLTVCEVPDENWVAISQAALPPVTAGRFTVHGSHDRGRVPRGPNTLLIDAGEAFGTAHHATTLGCLMAIDKLARRRTYRRVLDLGSGSGVLAIAASRALPRAKVLASDIDPLAVMVARGNVRHNGVAPDRLRVIAAAGLAHPALRPGGFDLIVANILAAPLIGLAKGIAGLVPGGGTLVLSGLLVPQAPQVIAAYRSAGFALVEHQRIVGWSTLTLKRR